MADHKEHEEELAQLMEWLRTDPHGSTAQLRTELTRLSQDRQEQVLSSVAEVLLHRQQVQLRLIDALQQELRHALRHPGKVEFTPSEVRLFAWMREAFRAHGLMTSGLLDKFLNRLPEQYMIHLIEEPYKQEQSLSVRVRELEWWISSTWREDTGREFTLRMLTQQRGHLIGHYTQHYLALFMEAYRDGVIPGLCPAIHAVDVKARSQRWGWFLSYRVTHS